MAYTNILTENADSICTITVNRPDKLNALTRQTIQEIGEAIDVAERDAEIKVIILTGAGAKAFVAGADISEFAHFGEKEGAELAHAGQMVFNHIENCSKPVIAAINGFALGGGCELAMSCHIRMASDNARFGQPEVKLGLIPGYGGTQRLVRLIGSSKAMELLLTGDMLSAAEAHALGLVNHVTTPDELMTKTRELAGRIAKQAPLAVSGIIGCVNAFNSKNSDGFATEISEFGKCFLTEDFQEGATAFLEKRAPVFKGK